MKYKRRLRLRITFSFVLFGLLLSLVVAIGAYLTIEDIEIELTERGLKAELNYFLQQQEKLPGSAQISAKLTRYYVTTGREEIVPDFARNLSPGTHEVHRNGYLYHVLIANVAPGTVYLILDATQFEHREESIQSALIVTVLIASLVALWLGIWLSGKVISPVSTLARQVAELKTNGHIIPKLASQYADDEVGQLAATFDNYLQEIEDLIRREQEFTSDASHELRTPLTIINGAAELLQDNPELSARARSQVERILRASDRMSQMLEVLLLLAREHPSSRHPNQESCQAQEVALEVVEQHRFLVQDKPVKLRTEIISNFSLPVSKTMLSIVLGNLVRNAINYTERGEVTIRVQNKTIEIIDTGAGISADDLQHIFERRYRGRSAQTSGSGLGLSIVKRICDRHHWTMDIKSELGHGTAIYLHF